MPEDNTGQFTLTPAILAGLVVLALAILVGLTISFRGAIHA